MLDQPLTRETVTPPTELPERVDVQIRQAHQPVRGDATGASVDPRLTDAARARFANADQHAFIGVLIERQVRDPLHLGAKL
jgi:hypothetical protein